MPLLVSEFTHVQQVYTVQAQVRYIKETFNHTAATMLHAKLLEVLSLQQLSQVQVLWIVREDAEKLPKRWPVVRSVLPAFEHD